MNGLSQVCEIRLTRREKEVLSYIALGLSTKQIAGQLYISEFTVANHRKNMLAKMGAHSSAELVRINIKNSSN